jgi:hypothetical protein
MIVPRTIITQYRLGLAEEPLDGYVTNIHTHPRRNETPMAPSKTETVSNQKPTAPTVPCTPCNHTRKNQNIMHPTILFFQPNLIYFI